MTTFDVYGSPTLDVLELRDRVASALGLRFVEHDSSYWGSYFEAAGPDDEEIDVYDNVTRPDEFEDPPFVEYPHVVSVVTASTERPAEIGRLLADAVGDLELLSHADHGPPAPPGPPTWFVDRHGSRTLDLHQVRDRLAADLGLTFTVRHHPLRGGDHHAATAPAGQSVYVVDNRVPVAGGTYADPADMITIVEVMGHPVGAEDLRKRLAGLAGIVAL